LSSEQARALRHVSSDCAPHTGEQYRAGEYRLDGNLVAVTYY
jgi:hypothetical protein